MQAQLNFTFDLGSAAGRIEFRRMFRHLLTSNNNDETLLDDRQGMPIAPDLEPAPAKVNPSSIPADPARAEAAKAGRQAAAAHARAAKAAAKAAPGNGAAEDLGDQLVGDEPDADDMGLADPSMSPGEAKEAGLALVRQMYAAGKVAEVKLLQKQYGVAKFYDVPLEKGHQFYREVLAISHKVMGAQA
jgi:hypothetical protein